MSSKEQDNTFKNVNEQENEEKIGKEERDGKKVYTENSLQQGVDTSGEQDNYTIGDDETAKQEERDKREFNEENVNTDIDKSIETDNKLNIQREVTNKEKGLSVDKKEETDNTEERDEGVNGDKSIEDLERWEPENRNKAYKESGDNKKDTYIKIAVSLIIVSLIVAIAFIVNNKPKDGKYIASRIDWLESKNPYIQLVVGPEQYVYLLYNKKGEAIAESSYGGQAFYRHDNKLVTINSTDVLIDTDLNPLSFIKATASIVDEGYGTIETTSTVNEDTGDKNMLYTMTVDGKENIKKIYDTVGDTKYSDTSMEMLLTGFEDVEPVTLTLKVSEGQNDEFGAACSINFGGGEENEYTSWVFDGYISTFDWELESGWYSNDTTNIENWNILSSVLVDEIDVKMSDFMASNNLAVSESETGKITAEQFNSYTEDEKLNTISLLREDILNLGYSLSCEDSDILVEIEKYITDTTATETNILQIGINIATDKGWLIENYTDGQQVDTTESVEEDTVDIMEEQTETESTLTE